MGLPARTVRTQPQQLLQELHVSSSAVDRPNPGMAQAATCLCGKPAVVRKRPWRVHPWQGWQLTRRYLACARKPQKSRCAFQEYLD